MERVSVTVSDLKHYCLQHFVLSQVPLTLDSVDDPASVGFPLFEGGTCLPINSPGGNCTVGGFPTYVVNVSTVAHIQLAINFARNANLRLVVKNKGHDYNAKSTGGGGLSISTNYLRDVRYLPIYSHGNYSGPALKVGVGAEVGTLYRYADSLNLSVVGGLGAVRHVPSLLFVSSQPQVLIHLLVSEFD